MGVFDLRFSGCIGPGGGGGALFGYVKLGLLRF